MSGRNVFGLIPPLVALLIMSGCSSKESLLVPGQTESDCSNKASKFGVCGSPRSIYEHQDQIKQIYYEEGQSYRVDRDGKIFNTESGKEIVPGARQGASGKNECPGCEINGGSRSASADEPKITAAASLSSKLGADVMLANRSLVIDTPQQAAVIRDMGWQQKIWIAPYENFAGDLIESHGVYAVIKEPQWVVGEREPLSVKRGVVVPTPLVTEVLTDRHNATSRKTQFEIDQYLRTELNKNINKINAFVDKKNDTTVKDQNAPGASGTQNIKPRPIFKPKVKSALEPVSSQNSTLLTPIYNGDLK